MSEWLVVYSLECRADLCASVGNQIISKTSSIENQQRQPENPFSVFSFAKTRFARFQAAFLQSRPSPNKRLSQSSHPPVSSRRANSRAHDSVSGRRNTARISFASQ